MLSMLSHVHSRLLLQLLLIMQGWTVLNQFHSYAQSITKKGSNAGIDVITGRVGDIAELGTSEAFKVKQAVLLSATEAAEMILRVDEIIMCAPRQREDRM